MKKLISLTLLLSTTALLFSGCSKSQSREDLDKKIADIVRQSQEDLDKIKIDSFKFLDDGGQPGKVTLNGVAVKDSDKIDSRISIIHIAGLNKSGSATATTKNLIALNSMTAEKLASSTVAVKKTETERTYINLGCELTESEIAGLSDISDKADLKAASISLNASRVFICGELKVNSESFALNITASDIMLKNASIVMQKFTGTVRLESNTLVLTEKNKITTLGEDNSNLVISAPEIDLFVATEIYGDGELTLESIGGNKIKASVSQK